MRIDEWAGIEVSEIVLQEAAQWIAELDNSANRAPLEVDEASYAANLALYEKKSTARQLAFYDWLGRDPSHQQAYAELSEIWAKTACIKSMAAAIKTSKVIEMPVNAAKPFEIPLFPNGKRASSSYEPTSFAPAWAYSASMVLILVGMLVPAFQSLL